MRAKLAERASIVEWHKVAEMWDADGARPEAIGVVSETARCCKVKLVVDKD